MAITLNASTSSGLVQTADTSGVIELQNNGTTKLTVNSSGVNIGQYNPSVSLITSGTAVSASGTSVDFTGIPSWVNRITFMYSGVSTNGGSSIQFQIGTSSGYETTSYVSGNIYGASTTGFLMVINPAASYLQYGTQVFTKLTGNTWVQNGACLTDGIAITVTLGSKTLSGTLDRIRLTTVNGTDAFDAGTVNILYE